MEKHDVLKKPEEHLKGEQKKVYRLEPSGPVLVKGGAGSGKTLVAIARARFLNEYAHSLFGVAKVGFFTYDKSLRDEVASYIGTTSIVVDNIDRWVNRFLRGRGYAIGRLPGKETRQEFSACMAQAKAKAFDAHSERAIFQKRNDFYEDEIAWIKGRQIEDEETYLKTPRTGRGTADRVVAEDRRYLWALKKAYDECIAANGLEMYEDLVNAAVKSITATPLTEEESFSYVIVDEAQDFTLAKLRLISLITNGTPETKSMTMFADAAQKIYQSGFSWKEANISVHRGRSYEFTKNYRNTRQIAEAAYSLIAHEEDKSEMTPMDLPEKQGEKPLLLIGSNQALLVNELVRKVNQIPQNEKVVFAAYGNRELAVLKALLESRGFVVDSYGATNRHALNLSGKRVVYVRSLCKLKGLQFDHVFLWNLTEGQFPPGSDADKDISRFRMLLYVAMTRACETLTLISFGTPAALVNEIDPTLLTIKRIGTVGKVIYKESSHV